MRNIIICIISLLLVFSCGKSKNKVSKPVLSTDELINNQAIEVYKEGLVALNDGDFFYASKKFSEAESLLPQTDWAGKAARMASFCLYTINFYDQAILNLERFIKITLEYIIAHYLITIIL